MTEFMTKFNTQYHIGDMVKKGKADYNKKLYIINIITLFTLVLFVSTLVLWIRQLGLRYDSSRIMLLTFAWVISFVVCFVSSIMACMYCGTDKSDSIVDKKIITETDGIENFFSSWNTQYFLPNGLYVMAPRNLKYLQFVLDSNVKFTLENHGYPHDLIPRGR